MVSKMVAFTPIFTKSFLPQSSVSDHLCVPGGGNLGIYLVAIELVLMIALIGTSNSAKNLYFIG